MGKTSTKRQKKDKKRKGEDTTPAAEAPAASPASKPTPPSSKKRRKTKPATAAAATSTAAAADDSGLSSLFAAAPAATADLAVIPGSISLTKAQKAEAKAKAKAEAMAAKDTDKTGKKTTKAPTKGGKKSAPVPKPADPAKDARTVFFGNVALGVSKRLLRRIVTSFVSDDAFRARAVKSDGDLAPKRDGDDDDDEEEEDGDDDAAVQEGAKKGSGAAAGAGSGSGSGSGSGAGVTVVEAIRFRSVPVKALAVESGSNYKRMRKAAAITGSFDSSVKTTLNAYVVLKSEDLVATACKLNGMVLRGHRLRVDAATAASAAPDTKKSVYVGNIPFLASDDELRAVFVPLVDGGNASIKYVRIVRDKATSRGKGFGYVAFTERSHVFQALVANGKKLRDRELRVTRCKPMEKQKSAVSFEGERSKPTEKSTAAMRRLTQKTTAQKIRAAAKAKRTKKTLSSMSKAIKAHNKALKKAGR